MLGIMRKYKSSIIIKGVFILIVLSFVGTIFLIWGEGEEGFKGSSYALKVNGEKIPYEDYSRAYEQAKNSIQQIYGQPVTPEIEKQLGIRNMVIKNLVGLALMKQEAKRMGLKVTKDEVVAAIAAIPAFQKNGAFDKQQYEEILQMNRITPKAFEEAQKSELLMAKARKAVADRVSVTDEQALQTFRKQHDRIELNFVSHSPADARNRVKITEQGLNAYLQQHEKDFRTQEQISISYALLTPEKVAESITVTNDEIQTYYQKNIDRYQGKDGILPLDQVKDRARADALRFKAAKRAYEAVADALNKNMKTADLKGAARQLDVPISDTPMFTQKNPPASLAGETNLIQKAFMLRQGELGGPVETGRGVYLFKIAARKPAAVPPLASIRAQVEKGFIDEEARALAAAMARETQAKLSKGSANGNIQETGPFSFSDKGSIPGIGVAPEIMEAAFTLTKASPTPSEPLFANGRWYAIRLKSRTEADTAAFQKEKEQIKQSLLPRLQQESLQKWMEGLYEKYKDKIKVHPALERE